MTWLVVLLVALGGVGKGGKLYIKGSGVTMFDSPQLSGKKTSLKAGDEVTWLGADEKNKSVQAVEVRGKKGFVHVTQLTPNKPSDEIDDQGKPIPSAAFASYRSKPIPVQGPQAAALTELEASSESAKSKVAEHVTRTGLKESK